MKNIKRRPKKIIKDQKDYVDNDLLLAALIEYKKQVKEAEKLHLPKPRIPEYIGKCFLDIATKLSYKGNFMNYTYREEFVSDGVENSIQYMNNFDPAKSSSPFAYFTTIIIYAFIRRIKKEKKQTYVKCKYLENSNLLDDDEVHKWFQKNDLLINQKQDFIQQFEEGLSRKRKSIKEKKQTRMESLLKDKTGNDNDGG
jgi:hypothetical protein